jgi:hypothetical protein
VVTPNSKQWHAVIDLSSFPKPSTCLAAAPRLQSPQEGGLTTRRIPEFPCDHTSAVPARVFVGAGAPQINVPAKAINGLAAHAAESRSPRVRVLSIWRWRCSEGDRQTAFAIATKLPRPTSRCPLRAARARANRSARIGCARQYESIASRGVGGMNGRLSARASTAGGKIAVNFLERRVSACLFLSALSSSHLDIPGPVDEAIIPSNP